MMNLSDFPSQFIENGLTDYDKLAFYADLDRIENYKLKNKLQDYGLLAMSNEGVGWGDMTGVGIFDEGKKSSQVLMENYEAFLKSPQYFKLSILDRFLERFANRMGKEFDDINKFITRTENKLKNENLTPKEIERISQDFKKALDTFVKNITMDDDIKKELLFYIKVFEKIDSLQKQRDEYLEIKYKPLLDYIANKNKMELKRAFGKDVEGLFDEVNLKNYLEFLQELHKHYIENNNSYSNIEKNSKLFLRYVNYKNFFEENGLLFPQNDKEIKQQQQAIKNILAIQKDVELFNEMASNITKQIFEVREHNGVDYYYALAKRANMNDENIDKEELIVTQKELGKKFIQSVLEEAKRAKIDITEDEAKSMILNISRKVQQLENENPLMKADATMQCNIHTGSDYSFLNEASMNIIKDAIMLELLKKSKHFQDMDDEVVIKVLENDTARGNYLKRPDAKEVNDIVNIYNLLEKVHNQELTKRDALEIIDNIFIDNKLILSKVDKEAFARSVEKQADLIEKNAQVFGEKMTNEQVTKNIAEKKYYLYYRENFLEKKGIRKFINNLAMGSSILQLHNCMARGQFALNSYESPASNARECFDKFIDQARRNADEKLNKALQNAQNPLVASNPFMIFILLSKIISEAKVLETELNLLTFYQTINDEAYYINSAIDAKEQQARLAVFNTNIDNGYQTVIQRGYENEFEDEINNEAIVYNMRNIDKNEGFFLDEVIELPDTIDKDDENLKQVQKLKNKIDQNLKQIEEIRKPLTEIENLNKKIEELQNRIQDAGILERRKLRKERNALIEQKEQLQRQISDNINKIEQKTQELENGINEYTQELEKLLQNVKNPQERLALKEVQGYIEYDKLDNEERKYLIQAFANKNREVLRDLIDGKHHKDANAVIENNQKIINRLQRDLLVDKETVYRSLLTPEYRKIIRKSGISEGVEKDLTDGNYLDAIAKIKQVDTLKESEKSKLVERFNVMNNIEDIINDISNGNMLNAYTLKNYLHNIETRDKNLYELLHNSNGIAMDYSKSVQKGKNTLVMLNKGMEAYFIDIANEIENSMDIKEIKKLKNFIEKNEDMKFVSINKETAQNILTKLNRSEANKLLDNYRKISNRQRSNAPVL